MKKFFFGMLLISLSFLTEAQCTSGSLIKVKTTRTSRYEYILFTFKGHSAPPFTIRNATPPFTHGSSGEPIHLKGCRFKSVSFLGNVYCTIQYALHSLPFTVIRDVKNAEQFEGQYEYLIGLRCAPSKMISYSYAAGNNTVHVLRFKR